MSDRTEILTGNWYLHKNWFWYVVMVEVVVTQPNYDSFLNHIGDSTWKQFREGTPDDFYKLNIPHETLS
jgi:hypothetical protein